MSRIGRKPITIPEGVQVTVDGLIVKAAGPKGTLAKEVPAGFELKLEGSVLSITPKEAILAEKNTNALWGTWRQHVANMVQGVKEGYEKKLEIEGVGYKAAVQGTSLALEVGFTNPVILQIPEGVSVSVEKNVISVSGAEKEKIGQFASQVRKARKAEPYKGKGIKYVGEQIRRKLGKRAAATTAGPAK